jgi:MFS family permease
MSEPKPTAATKTGFFSAYGAVIAAFLILLAYSAGRSAFGIFFEPMVSEFAWSSALMSGAFSLSIVIDGSLGILTGRFADRLGPRKVLTFCGILAGAGYILISLVNSSWQMYLFYGIIVGAGMSGIFVPISTTIPKWYTRRNTINGIVLAGMGVGTFIVAPMSDWLISVFQWRWSYVIIGAAFIVVIVAATQFFKMSSNPAVRARENRSEVIKGLSKPPARNFTFSEALRTKQLWLVFAMMVCFGFPLVSITVHIVPNIIHLKIPAAEAASVMAVIGLTSIFGRIFFGYIADKIGPRQTLLAGFIAVAAVVFWLIFITDIRGFYAFAAIWGFCSSGMGTVQVPLAAELFGLKSLGAIFGFCGLGTMTGASIGPVVCGYIFDISHGYSIAFGICAGLAVAGIVLNLILSRNGPRPQPISMNNGS